MTEKDAPRRPLVLVEWTDARGVGAAWDEINKMCQGVCAVSSVGFLAKETDEYMMLVPHIGDEGDDEDQGIGEMYIPKTAIKRRVVLTEG